MSTSILAEQAKDVPRPASDCKLDSSSCDLRTRNAIRAFNRKRFVTGELSYDSWYEIVIENLVSRDPANLRSFTLEDLVSRFNVDRNVLSHLSEKWDIQPQISCLPETDESLQFAPPEKPNFFRSKFPRNVVFVDEKETFLRSVELLNQVDLVGLDAEWKPDVTGFDFSDGRLRPISTLQIATRADCFIFDFIKLLVLLNDEDWEHLGQFLERPDVMKIGFALHGDLARMREVSVFRDERTARYPNVLDLEAIGRKLAMKHPEVFGMLIGQLDFDIPSLRFANLGVANPTREIIQKKIRFSYAKKWILWSVASQRTVILFL